MTVGPRRVSVVCVLVLEDWQTCKNVDQLCKEEVNIHYQHITTKC